MAAMGSSLETPAGGPPPQCPLCHQNCRRPTSLRCGHCFCKRCIQELWSGSPTGPVYCPECREEYRKLPAFASENEALQAPCVEPRGISDTADEQAHTFPGCPSNVAQNSMVVFCHYCPPGTLKQPAAKTCLVCGASMCGKHLKPHLESPVFQSHPLVDPLADISQWRCQEHQEMNKVFCRDCATCVCTTCTVVGSHRAHACVGVSEAEKELRENLKKELKETQEHEEEVQSVVNKLTKKKQSMQLLLDNARNRVQEQYEAMRDALGREELQALQSLAREECRVLGAVGEQLEQQQGILEAIQLTAGKLEDLMDDRGGSCIQNQAFIVEYNKMRESLSGISRPTEDLEPVEVDKCRVQQLQVWVEKRLNTVALSVPDRETLCLLYGTVPSLNQDTAHPKLVLSEKNRMVTYSEDPQPYPELVSRFSVYPQVLASRPHEAGRVYWEVEVLGEGRWKVGICDALISRKGADNSSRLGYNAHSWCLLGEWNKLEVLHNAESAYLGDSPPRRVGVYLDLEEDLLSFYSVTEDCHLQLLHSFQHKFTQPVYPALAVSKSRLSFYSLFSSIVIE